MVSAESRKPNWLCPSIKKKQLPGVSVEDTEDK